MKALRLTLLYALLPVFATSSTLRGQRRELPKKAVKSEMRANDASSSSASLETFVTDENADRRVPDDAPTNANQDAYAALLNKNDVVYQDMQFRPADDGDLFTKSNSEVQKQNTHGPLASFEERHPQRL